MSLWKENRKWNKVFRVCRNPSKSIHTVDSLLKVIYQRILKYRYRLDASSYCGQVTWVEFRTGLRSIFKSSRKRVSDHHDNFVQSATNSKEKTSRLFWVELVSYKLTLLKEIRPALSCGFCFFGRCYGHRKLYRRKTINLYSRSDFTVGNPPRRFLMPNWVHFLGTLRNTLVST